MSKTYWLITSNSKPTPEEKEKTLILHGVNAHDIKQLIQVEENRNFFYIKKEDGYHIHKQKENLKTKLNNFIKTLFLFPSGVWIGFVFVFLFLIVSVILISYENIKWSITCAFVAVSLSLFLGFFKYLLNDHVFGTVIGFIISIALGVKLSDIYLQYAYYFENNIKFLDINNIGNFLTVLGLFFSFIGYIRDVFSYFEYDVRIAQGKQDLDN